MVADAFELAGWDVRYLGPDTPAPPLVQLVRDERPDVVALSAALPDHLRAVRDTVVCLHTELGEACPAVLLGGLAINQLPPLTTVLGADATSPDARAAVAAGAQLASSP